MAGGKHRHASKRQNLEAARAISSVAFKARQDLRRDFRAFARN
jgi:hypothetical protein